jgi:hypothetical protein
MDGIKHRVSCQVAAWITAGLFIPVLASAAPPRIFYSDLESGPNSGGEKNGGAYVTIYGHGFGSTRDTSFVTVGNGRASVYPVWSDSKIAFQLNASTSTGSILVTTTAGSSNPLPFTIRAGKIYFVTTTGNDSNNGAFANPWRTILHARDAIRAGDTVYVGNGVTQSTDDGSGYSTCFHLPYFAGSGGKPGNPIAMVVYPGAQATIGNVLGTASGGCSFGIRGNSPYWTFAGFNLRGGDIALDTGPNNHRYIGNDMSCPNGNGQAGCLDISQFSYFYIYGNYIHHVGTNLAPGKVTALYHGVYISEQADHLYFGWNTIAHVQGCRGFQQNINAGNDVYDIHVHDNVIHDTQCDGIVAGSMDPSLGTVEFYNNIIYNAGKGPNNAEGTGSWACMHLGGGHANGGAQGKGTIEVYNNTMYNCGSFATPNYGGSNAALIWSDGDNGSENVRLRNNIFVVPTRIPYIVLYAFNHCSSNCSQIQGSNNLFFGNGAPPRNASLTGSLNRDPMFVNAAQNDFHLTAASPAKQSGVDLGPTWDYDGNPRTGSAGYSIGAFQYTGATASALCQLPARITAALACHDVRLEAVAPPKALETP